MTQLYTLHFVDHDAQSRVDGARLTVALGHHAEVYATLDEVIQRAPSSGIIVVRDDLVDGGVQEIVSIFPQHGISLPVIIASQASEVGRVVEALRAGAIDYLSLPFTADQIAAALNRADGYARAVGKVRQLMIEARAKVAALSEREREVLDLLCQGASNKLIARELSISPRTVEIHRANMMDKLDAKHAADAVRIRFESIPEWVIRGWSA